MNIDLHAHSTASDGTLSPAALVRHAKDCGVDVLALTDHDSTAGFAEASAEAEVQGVHLLCGVEVSVTWARCTVHIVGLDVDPNHPDLVAGLAGIAQERDRRAQKMGLGLERQGVVNAREKAAALASGGLIARTHYARLLIQEGLAKDVSQAIKRYLSRGKPAFVAGQWASLEEAVAWIRAAGGVAVIAHPARYGFTVTKLRALMSDFKAAGGAAIEVLSGSHSSDEARAMARHARWAGLCGSRGSDYHGPENPWVELGRLPSLPEDVEPVWDRFQGLPQKRSETLADLAH